MNRSDKPETQNEINKLNENSVKILVSIGKFSEVKQQQKREFTSKLNKSFIFSTILYSPLNILTI